MSARRPDGGRLTAGTTLPLAAALLAAAAAAGPLAAQAPPEDLEATEVTGTRVELEWSPPDPDDEEDGAIVVYYNLYRDGAHVTSRQGTSYEDTGLEPATTYRYHVTAATAFRGESEPSNEVVVTTRDTTPPTVPERLRTTAVESTRVDLAWSEASDEETGVDHYRLFRDGSELATVEETSYSDRDLEPSTEYRYRVSAVNGHELESDRSEAASARTDDPPEPRDRVPPAPPTGLRVES